jgi:hypothetical protein
MRFLRAALREDFLKALEIIFSSILAKSLPSSHELQKLFLIVLLEILHLVPNFTT